MTAWTTFRFHAADRLVVLLVVSAFFSISETSMMALNRYRLRHLVQQRQPRRAARVATARADRQLLGVVLLGNNLSTRPRRCWSA